MRTNYQLSLATLFSEIDKQIAKAQTTSIEPGNDDHLFIVAKLTSDLYDSREKVEAQLALEI